MTSAPAHALQQAATHRKRGNRRPKSKKFASTSSYCRVSGCKGAGAGGTEIRMGAVMIYSRDQRDVGAGLAGRGHHVVYRAEETNRCPGCGRVNWLVGRQTAECAFCGTAIALAEAKW